MSDANRDLYLVAIGASAGGLQALQEFFGAIEPELNCAYIVVQHLDPHHKTLLADLLSRHSNLPIQIVRDTATIEKGHVYVIAEGVSINALTRTTIQVKKSATANEHYLPINGLFEMASLTWREHLIAVVMSGSGSDGAKSLSSIKIHRGTVLVQAPESAAFAGMPEAAINTGQVDLADHIPELLLFIKQLTLGYLKPDKPEEVQHKYRPVLAKLHADLGGQFANYKATTVNRRIERRMELFDCSDLGAYLELLDQNPQELDALYYDLLIGVTHFFRDKAAFNYLADVTIPKIVAKAKTDEMIRIWVPACATGEEVYSIAMLFQEEIAASRPGLQFRIFATDVHRGSLAAAALGIYNQAMVRDNVPSALLQKYFVERSDDKLQVDLKLRKKVIFSHQNLLSDPPFTAIDLLCCRNLLIYFNPEAQQRVMRILHYCLKVDGFLFLGCSESVGEQFGFTICNQTWKIFQKNSEVRERLPSYDFKFKALPKNLEPYNPPGDKLPASISEICELLLAKYMTSSLVVDNNFNLHYVFGKARDIVRFPIGATKLTIAKVIPGETGALIHTALVECKRKNARVTIHAAAAPDLDLDGPFDVVIDPMDLKRSERYFFVGFVDNARQAHSAFAKSSVDTKNRVTLLEGQLQEVRQSLLIAHQELEANNEQLQASNEELVTSNEELQSTNEELHSLNEELHTVNSEFQQKIEELAGLNADLDNLLVATKVGTMFIDSDFNVRKATDNISDYFHFRDSDIGRQVAELQPRFRYDDIIADVKEVMKTNKEIEREVFIQPSRWAFVRILPYVSKGAASGAVLSCVDITEVKKMGASLDQDGDAAIETLEKMLNLNPIPTMAIGFGGKILLINNASKDLLGYSRKELVGQSVEMLVPPELQTQHAEVRKRFLEERHGKRSLGQGRILPVVTKKGHVIPCDIGLYRITTNKGGYVLCILVDNRPPYQPRD